MLPGLLLAAEATVLADGGGGVAGPAGPAAAALPAAGSPRPRLSRRPHPRARQLRRRPELPRASSRSAPGPACSPCSALVPQWVRLLYWPAHLQADYSSQETRVVHTPDLAVAFGAAILLGAIADRRPLPPSRPVVALGIFWVLIALFPTSNLVLPTGIVLAERTMLLPSVGALLVLGALCRHAAGARGNDRDAVVRSLAAAGLAHHRAAALRSAARQPVWANDEVLKPQMVIDAPRSYWAHWLYGDYLYHTDRLAEGERHMRLAVELEPDNAYIQMLLGQRYQDHGFCQPAVAVSRPRRGADAGTVADPAAADPVPARPRPFDDARAQVRTGLGVGLSPTDFKAALRSVDSAAAPVAAATGETRAAPLARPVGHRPGAGGLADQPRQRLRLRRPVHHRRQSPGPRPRRRLAALRSDLLAARSRHRALPAADGPAVRRAMGAGAGQYRCSFTWSTSCSTPGSPPWCSGAPWPCSPRGPPGWRPPSSRCTRSTWKRWAMWWARPS